MNSVFNTPARLSIAASVLLLLVSGCSGSGTSEPSTGANTVLSDTNVADASGMDSAGADTTQANSDGAVTETSGTETSGTDTSGTDTSGTETTGTETTGTEINNEPTQDPPTNVTTTVYFEITVPAYMSNALNVELVWGSKALSAKWVGDEFWTVSDEFPTNARLPLIVTFTDAFGDIVLGTFEQEFRTGTNESEVYTITADQFDSQKWDSDGDGVSNLSESLAGSNPLIVQNDSLEIRDAYTSGGAYARRAMEIEALIPSLPFFEHMEDVTPLKWNEDYSRYTSGLSDIQTIDMDENGTGTFYDYYKYEEPSDVTVENETADRTNTGHSIILSGAYKRTNSGAGVRIENEYTIETTAIDALTRTQTAITYFNSSGYSDSIENEFSYTLTGTVTDDSLLCKPAYGTFSSSIKYRYSSKEAETVKVTKGIDDQYWLVNKTTPNGTVLEEYLAQEFGSDFFCGFRGLPPAAE